MENQWQSCDNRIASEGNTKIGGGITSNTLKAANQKHKNSALNLLSLCVLKICVTFM